MLVPLAFLFRRVRRSLKALFVACPPRETEAVRAMLASTGPVEMQVVQ